MVITRSDDEHLPFNRSCDAAVIIIIIAHRSNITTALLLSSRSTTGTRVSHCLTCFYRIQGLDQVGILQNFCIVYGFCESQLHILPRVLITLQVVLFYDTSVTLDTIAQKKSQVIV